MGTANQSSLKRRVQDIAGSTGFAVGVFIVVALLTGVALWMFRPPIPGTTGQHGSPVLANFLLWGGMGALALLFFVLAYQSRRRSTQE